MIAARDIDIKPIHRLLMTVIAVFSLMIFGGSPAYAADSSDLLENATDLVAEIAPEILPETADDHHLSVHEDANGAWVQVADIDNGSGAEGASGVSFSIDYVSNGIDSHGDFDVIADDQAAFAAYVQPTTFGVRVITAIADRRAPTDYRYTFDVPGGTELVEGEFAFYLQSGGDVLGSLSKPWARDSQGRQVPTSYSWSGRTLTQHVDLSSPDIEYPVLADPAWGYTYQYSLTKTAAQNKALLKKCFNCYFPVAGAPRNFPRAGQLLPLRVLDQNFECRFKREVTGADYFGFHFDATKNHIDGAGSSIVFEFRTVQGKRKLVVGAYIVRDTIFHRSDTYRVGAALTWQRFATNLNSAK